MKVMVTGGSGFVGSHIVSELVESGHTVRLLARTPVKVARALEPFGHPEVEVIRGSVLDEACVDEALQGCDAVIHAANIYSLDPRHRKVMWETNVGSTELVLGRAAEHGCARIIHVSSVMALYPAHEVIAADPPLGTNHRSAYARSKHGADQVARRLQDEGKPVVITYPGIACGPHDPGPGELIGLLRNALGHRYPFLFHKRAGLPIADVRWLARAHAALLEPKRLPPRLTMGGHYASWNDLFRVFRHLTGRRLPQVVPTPAIVALALGRLANFAQWFWPQRLPFSHETTWLLFHSAATDDHPVERLVGAPPPLRTTMTDAIRWAVDAGHLPPEWAGKLAAPVLSASPDDEAVPEPDSDHREFAPIVDDEEAEDPDDEDDGADTEVTKPPGDATAV